jgi:hypothetical protein
LVVSLLELCDLSNVTLPSFALSHLCALLAHCLPNSKLLNCIVQNTVSLELKPSFGVDVDSVKVVGNSLSQLREVIVHRRGEHLLSSISSHLNNLVRLDLSKALIADENVLSRALSCCAATLQG